MVKPLLALASGFGKQSRLSVLIFHRVLPTTDPLFPDELDARRFNDVCGWLRAWYDVLPLPEALDRLASGTLPTRACAITFDDGYADNYEIALPILASHGLSATFFIATGFLDGGRMWNDTVIETIRRTKKRELELHGLPGVGSVTLVTGTTDERRLAIDRLLALIKYLPMAERGAVTEQLAQNADVQLPNDLMMTSQQVRELHRAGMQIGAHTVSHPILAKLGAEAARVEISESKAFLEDLLGERVGLFAYPNGKPGTDYNAQSVALARACGFDGALSTAWGAADAENDRFQIPRFTPWDRHRLPFGLRMARNLMRRTTEPKLLNA